MTEHRARGQERRRLTIPVRPPNVWIGSIVSALVSWVDTIALADGEIGRQRPALETIEAMAASSVQRSRIVRSSASAENRLTPRCPECRRRAAVPMQARDARDVRRAVRQAGIDDSIAYAFAKTTVLVTASSQRRMCRCDRLAWANAIEEYQRSGIDAWRRIGVDP